MQKIKTGVLTFFLIVATGVLSASEDVIKPPKQTWSFEGPVATFDRGAVKRGFQVYKEVCSVCHGLNLLHYRDLAKVGFPENEIKAIAAEHEVKDGPNDEGEMFTRKALPSDKFVNPYTNEKAARAANGGAYPVDLSLITKARPHGPDYVYALLTGFKEALKDVTLFEGKYYNLYFPGHQISMAPPLTTAGQVTFGDGTTATIEQMAHDVTTFLAWASEPEMEERKRLGVKWILSFLVLAGLLYAIKKHIWKRIK